MKRVRDDARSRVGDESAAVLLLCALHSMELANVALYQRALQECGAGRTGSGRALLQRSQVSHLRRVKMIHEWLQCVEAVATGRLLSDARTYPVEAPLARLEHWEGRLLGAYQMRTTLLGPGPAHFIRSELLPLQLDTHAALRVIQNQARCDAP